MSETLRIFFDKSDRTFELRCRQFLFVMRYRGENEYSSCFVYLPGDKSEAPTDDELEAIHAIANTNFIKDKKEPGNYIGTIDVNKPPVILVLGHQKIMDEILIKFNVYPLSDNPPDPIKEVISRFTKEDKAINKTKKVKSTKFKYHYHILKSIAKSKKRSLN